MFHRRRSKSTSNSGRWNRGARTFRPKDVRLERITETGRSPWFARISPFCQVTIDRLPYFSLDKSGFGHHSLKAVWKHDGSIGVPWLHNFDALWMDPGPWMSRPNATGAGKIEVICSWFCLSKYVYNMLNLIVPPCTSQSVSIREHFEFSSSKHLQ